jgi:hypothetical protein
LPISKKTKKPPLRQFKLCGFFLLLLNNTTQIFLIASLLHQQRLISYLFSQPTFYPLTIFSFDSSLSLYLRDGGWGDDLYLFILLFLCWGNKTKKKRGDECDWISIRRLTDRLYKRGTGISIPPLPLCM